MKNLLIIDAQGGGIGKQIISEIKKAKLDIMITAVGTNSIATGQMLKAGADRAATGENPVVVNCRKADIIIGPVGIVIADSMLGEITPLMACSIGQSQAIKILLPMNQCDNYIVGVSDCNVKKMIEEVISKIKNILEGESHGRCCK